MKKLSVLAAALLACAVGPEQAVPTSAAPVPLEVRRASAPSAPIAMAEELDVASLVRPRKDLEVNDLFSNAAAPRPPAPSAAPTAEPVVAAPTAPPLPYTYLGRMTKGGKAIVYLVRNGDMLLAEKGSTLDGTYLVEDISSSTIDFVYLPLQARQALNVTQAP